MAANTGDSSKTSSPLKDYWLRYRMQGRGACVGVIQARSLEAAERLGREYCAQDPARVYLTVEDPVLVSE
jgi:hypothetical protein